MSSAGAPDMPANSFRDILPFNPGTTLNVPENICFAGAPFSPRKSLAGISPVRFVRVKVLLNIFDVGAPSISANRSSGIVPLNVDLAKVQKNISFIGLP